MRPWFDNYDANVYNLDDGRFMTPVEIDVRRIYVRPR